MVINEGINMRKNGCSKCIIVEDDNSKVYKGVMSLLCMKQRTNIQIEHSTLEKLRNLKISERETYDELLNRVINSVPKEVLEITKRIKNGMIDDELLRKIAYDALTKEDGGSKK
jgi:hypothetical protein